MSHSLRTAALSTVAGILLVAGLGIAPAAAEKPEGTPPGQARQDERADRGDRDGDADRDPGTAYTEDDDTNDGGTPNNVADDGDNAHPSGRDRSVENGGSGNQGRSESDPDDDGRGPDRSNGGPDKPNGRGGVDQADQDGNNGCGNDDDFEDDNEGWCGRKPHDEKPEKPVATATDDDECAGGSMHHECTSEDDGECPAGSMSHACDDDTYVDDADDADDADTDADDDADDDADGDADDDADDTDTDDVETPASTTTADAADRRLTIDACPDADEMPADWTMPASCATTDVAADDDEDEAAVTEVRSLELRASGGAAVAEPVSSVHSVSATGSVLAGLPIIGDAVSGQLPFTGANTMTLVAAGLAALALGFVLVRATRRRSI